MFDFLIFFIGFESTCNCGLNPISADQISCAFLLNQNARNLSCLFFTGQKKKERKTKHQKAGIRFAVCVFGVIMVYGSKVWSSTGSCH